MLIISENKNISHSVEDSFELIVTSSSGFSEGASLRFEISKNEDTAPLISNTYNVQDDSFTIYLDEEDRKKLKIGRYIYRIIVISSGKVTTEQSGNLEVKWGC